MELLDLEPFHEFYHKKIEREEYRDLLYKMKYAFLPSFPKYTLLTLLRSCVNRGGSIPPEQWEAIGIIIQVLSNNIILTDLKAFIQWPSSRKSSIRKEVYRSRKLGLLRLPSET